ncbi:uncharacterized protein [Oryza sativa Japonica Group]|uniref:uncharacterized protein isoform X2 n=1 Tax=Oryza sativa subsp. japonica TaxID=39947 RepID=UPI0029172DAE|nr:hypothetical protein DAI22_12g171050 [Oryza sativa Japonica Group]
MGYMSMAVRVMGYLVVLWTTVILLGGFVSALEKKDFWCFTIITLVQTIGVSTVFPRENLKKIVLSYILGFVSTTYTFYVPKNSKDDKNIRAENMKDEDGDGGRRTSKEKPKHWPRWLRRLAAFVAYLVQQLVFAVVAGPLALAVAVLYACGLVITTGLAAWRLLHRDYGDGSNNLRPALDVLYTMVLLQGVLSYYRFSSDFWQSRLTNNVAKAYNFHHWRHFYAFVSLRRYIHETRIGCEKDPSFAKRRNLVKYAVDTMIESEFPNCWSFVCGASILGALLENPKLEEQHSLIKEHLAWSPSGAGDLLQKLVQSLDPARGYHYITSISAARILAHLAGDLRREQLNFPQGIHSIASLVEPPGDEKGDEYNALEHFQELMVEGLRLLAKLVSDEEWCRVIAEKEGLLAKIMVPLRSDMHHTKYHSVCSDSERPICREMIGASIQVMRQSGDYSWRHRRDGTL